MIMYGYISNDRMSFVLIRSQDFKRIGVIEAGLGHETGIRAKCKATKLQMESDQPLESCNRTSTGVTDCGPSGSGGEAAGKVWLTHRAFSAPEFLLR
jgi:hypothetical protein